MPSHLLVTNRQARAGVLVSGTHTVEVPSKLLVSHHPQPVKGPPLLMLTREEDVDAHALHRRDWTISAIGLIFGALPSSSPVGIAAGVARHPPGMNHSGQPGAAHARAAPPAQLAGLT